MSTASLPLTTSNVQPDILDEITKWLYIQIGTMAGAWALFIPLGILCAHQKWIFAQSKFLDLQIWFHLHRLFQLCGVGLFFASTVLYFIYLDKYMKQIEDVFGVEMINAYYWILISLICSSGFQVVFTLLRPPKSHKFRDHWNWIHRLVGMAVSGLGIAEVYIGVYLLNLLLGEDWLRWLIPITAPLFIIIVINMILWVLGVYREKWNAPYEG
jgi:hypothetical protein